MKAVCLLLAAACHGGASGPLVLAAAGETLAVTGVSVVDLQNGAILPRRTVVVAGGRLAAVGEALAPPAGARIVPGEGRFLLPGLADMHVHVDAADLPAYLDAGITTVRNLWGYPALRDLMTRSLDAAAPRIVSASPGVDGPGSPWPHTELITDPAAADALVDRLAAAGWSWIKAYSHLSRDVYEAVLKAAARNHLRVIGHVPFSVPIEDAIAMGHFSIEHLLGYERSLSSGRPYLDGWAAADPAAMSALAERTARAGAWNCPTNVVFMGSTASSGGEQRARALQRRREMVLALHRAGARLLAGTDSGIQITRPGSSLHDELADFVAAGLTPLEALRTATVNAAEFLGDPAPLSVGAPADLLLLEGNPLADLGVLRRPPVVILRGALYQRATAAARTPRAAP